MVIVMALFNVPQYTRMVSLTIYMMTEPESIFISIHCLDSGGSRISGRGGGGGGVITIFTVGTGGGVPLP